MYFVVGAGGFLGSYVIKNILSATADSVVAATRCGQTAFEENPRVTVVRFDACNATDIRKLCLLTEKSEPVKVVYLCAQHNIDIVAREPDNAYALNVTALENILRSLKNVKCLFFASSDTVYGEGGDYRFCETDKLSPVSIYGQHKAMGEKIVLSHGCNVLRLPFMFGKSLSPYKKHFCDIVCEKLLSGQNVNMFTDSIRSTMSFDAVAKVVVRLCEGYSAATPGVLNIAGDAALSKYEVGLRLADSLSADRKLVVPTLSQGTYEPGAQRAVSTLMDNTLLKKTLSLSEADAEEYNSIFTF